MMPIRFIFLLWIHYMQLSSSKKTIYFGAIVPAGYGQFVADRFGYEATINMAVEHINNRSDILQDYEIIVKFVDTHGVTRHTARRLVFEFYDPETWRKEPLQLVIGPAFSTNVLITVLISQYHNILMLSYAASSLEFFQGDSFYDFFYTNVPTVKSYNKARLAIIKRYGWKKIGCLYQFEDKRYNMATQDLMDLIKTENLTISVVKEGFSYHKILHPALQLQNLKKQDVRIIIGEFDNYAAVRVFCEAFKMGMFGARYVWFLTSASGSHWIFDPASFDRYPKAMRQNCNITHISKAAERFFVVNRISLREDNTTTFSGLTPMDFLREVKQRNVRSKDFTSYAFDAVFAAALAINRSLSGDPLFYPENFTRALQKGFELRDLLKKTEFEGISGPHRFYERQRQTIVRVSQMRLSEDNQASVVEVGTHDAFEDKLVLLKEQEKKLWKNGKVPRDAPLEQRRILEYSKYQVVTVGILSGLGILYAIGFLYFNISKRNYKVVRLSSPLINNVILFGCLLCYVFVLLFGIDSSVVSEDSYSILCNARLYILAIAFSLSFGALFSKTWRVHKIFTAQRAIKKKMMRDFHLLLFVLALVIIDVVYITIWIKYDPMKSRDIIIGTERDDVEDILATSVLKICDSKHASALLAGLYAYKGILLMFGLFLAWGTRNVTILALNDSKYIGISIYNVVMLSTVGVSVSMLLKTSSYYQLLHVTVSTVVLLSTTFTITIMFAPKLYQYYFTEPEPQERVRTMATLKSNSSFKTSTTEISDVYETVTKKDLKNKWVQTIDIQQESEKQKKGDPVNMEYQSFDENSGLDGTGTDGSHGNSLPASLSDISLQASLVNSGFTVDN